MGEGDVALLLLLTVRSFCHSGSGDEYPLSCFVCVCVWFVVVVVVVVVFWGVCSCLRSVKELGLQRGVAVGHTCCPSTCREGNAVERVPLSFLKSWPQEPVDVGAIA